MSPEELLGHVDALVRQHPPATSDPHEFLAARFDAGLAWVWAAPGEGGLGIDSELQPLVETRLAESDAPIPFSYNPVAIGMTGPTVLTHGTAQQKAAYLRPLYSGREIWSQLFSEPSVGSDVAGLATRARRDGDGWVVDGQKVWTSWAHIAKRGLLLARTDPDVPKHEGLTAFVLDMTAPGVEVRALRQMTGEAEFNEVYLTDVRIPDTDRLGDVGDGWRIATTTLMNERFSLGGTIKRDTAEVGAEVLDAYRAAVDRGDHNPIRRDEAIRLWIEANINELTAERAAAAADRGNPGPEASVLKLANAEYRKRVANFLVDLLGASGMLVGSYRMNRPDLPLGREVPETTSAFLRSRANTIEGGTSEILRNILGERVLGLPGDLRVDKGIPWRDIPR